ncbi:MAG TPA: glycosyltransferase family 2 protein [Thermoanaerobaculia bacterium]|jgi:GT2 family glycosyltransferase|nr:glycosyltransferase family 2 protein [Thermoanaerobaculia bacterium]
MGRLVSVALVTWNSAPWLRRCLDGIARQTHRDIELIAVDNASSDESASIISGATLIRNETNRGFSAAVNQAIAVAKGELVQLVNPDAFLEPDYIARLITAFDAADVGMATGKLLRADGTGIDSTGIRMTRTGRHLDINEDISGEVFGVSGAAAMYRMSFLNDVAINGEIFDEDFYVYREDADIAWRGRLLGWRAMCVPSAVAYHVRRVTPERRRELPPDINMHSLKNRFLLRLKNEGAYLALRNAPFELARDMVAVGAALTIERTSLPAFGWLWRNRRRILAKRRAIQSRRRVSDRDLARWFQ